MTSYLLPILILVRFSGSLTPAVTTLETFNISGEAQGTSYHISYASEKQQISKTSIDSIFENVDSSLSIYRPYSLVSRFNRSDTGIEMDHHLNTVVKASLAIFWSTAGISDITVYPLVNYWGFGPGQPSSMPNGDSLRKILACVGSEKLRIANHFLAKEIACVQIDLNGIAQGYTVDLISDFLETKGISNYLVELGGEIRTKGTKQPGNSPFAIGIESPVKNEIGQQEIRLILHPPAGAVTTSGNYRKYRESNGTMITHLIDPVSGFPFNNELISVTVFASKAITADGYDNALMGMGLIKAFAFLEKQKELEAYFVYRKADGAIADTATTGFYRFIK